MLPYEQRWYKDAIIYGVDVDYFFDADADGVGDLQGLMRKLDYIAELGVNCIWLMPVYPSPMRDNGYDVCDYYGVRKSAGTLGDLVELIERANRRGLRVIMDIIFNHTSDEHPWFRQAREHPQSSYRDFYIWSDHKARPIEGEGTMFPGEEDSVWSYDKQSNSWYYHRFYSCEPSLNLTNIAVREELQRILGFYLQCGSVGFRIDSASHMVEPKGIPESPIVAGHSILKELRRVTDAHGSAFLIGEADEDPDNIGKFFGDGDELQGLLNFLLCSYVFLALARERAEPVLNVLELLPKPPPTCHWVNFLRNLDELDLERLTRSQRKEVYAAFAPKEDMQIYGRGVRRRMAPMLGGNVDRLKMAYSLLFSLPGSPLVMYGDEIGMGEDLSRPGRSSVRTPMQWSSGPHGGFTSADPKVKPVHSGPFEFDRVNVESQQEDPDSLLNWIRKLSSVRRLNSEVGYADHETVETGNAALLAIRYCSRHNITTTIHNLSHEPQSASFEGVPFHKPKLQLDRAIADHCLEEGRIRLGPYGCAWISSEPPPDIEPPAEHTAKKQAETTE